MDEKYKHKIPNILSMFRLLLIPVIIWFHIPSVISGILIGACTALALLSAFLYGKENLRILSDGRKDNVQV